LPGPDAFAQIPELAERGRRRVELFLQKLDQQLEGRDFIATDFYSIADISALVVVDFATWIKIVVPDASANLRRWYEACSSRPSAKA
jgi:glutathione S-transferase